MNHTDKKKLQDVRIALIHLHKVLLDFQRHSYEKKHGRVRTHTEMFKLVTENKAFSWLRSLSLSIVAMDEALEDELLDSKRVESILSQTRALLKVTKGSGEFAQKLEKAVQTSPDVVMALGGVSGLLKVVTVH